MKRYRIKLAGRRNHWAVYYNATTEDMWVGEVHFANWAKSGYGWGAFSTDTIAAAKTGLIAEVRVPVFWTRRGAVLHLARVWDDANQANIEEQ